MKLPLDSSIPALRPCRYCGGGFGLVDSAKGPHGNGILCSACLRHIGWTPLGWRPTAIDTGVGRDDDDILADPEFTEAPDDTLIE